VGHGARHLGTVRVHHGGAKRAKARRPQGGEDVERAVPEVVVEPEGRGVPAPRIGEAIEHAHVGRITDGDACEAHALPELRRQLTDAPRAAGGRAIADVEHRLAPRTHQQRRRFLERDIEAHVPGGGLPGQLEVALQRGRVERADLVNRPPHGAGGVVHREHGDLVVALQSGDQLADEPPLRSQRLDGP
jgi:hypothetical protein